MNHDELIERLAKATEPDRELDCLLWSVGSGVELEWQGTTLVAGTVGVIGRIDPGQNSRNFSSNRAATGPDSIPAYTFSVDAALALIERVLPGHGWCARTDEVRGGYGNVYPEPNPNRVHHSSYAHTTALALCIACLKALRSADLAREEGR